MVNYIDYNYYRIKQGNLSDSEKAVLEILLKGKKAIYQISKEVKGNPPPRYSTIYRAVHNLEKKGLIKIFNEEVIRRQKFCEITIPGIIRHYDIKMNETDPLTFQRTGEALEILHILSEKLPEEIRINKESLFLHTLETAPSFIDFLLHFDELLSKEPSIINDKNLFRELIKNTTIPNNKPVFIGNELELHRKYILQHLPIIFLIKDLEKYPYDIKLRKSVTDGLIETDKNFIPISTIREDCVEHLYFYLPPIGGQPILACDGRCPKPCL